jgi:hypothetical protein
MTEIDYKIEELNILNKLTELELVLPDSLSFFPENLETATTKNDFIFTDSIVDLNKLFKQSNINVAYLGGDTELYRSRKNADIYFPAIFLSLSLISENSTIVSISLNVLSNYISDFLKGSIGKKTANVEFYIETKQKGIIKKISYKGDAEGVKNLEQVIKALK